MLFSLFRLFSTLESNKESCFLQIKKRMNGENEGKGTTLNACFLTRVQFEKMHTQGSFVAFLPAVMLMRCNMLDVETAVHGSLDDICPGDVVVGIPGLV